ncbi:VUT family protein [Streptomyces sp. NPDC056683]|uniref:VUT family protein n=1 Tax=Streptomyces sp. NPDC056683 TaxID=3345910 RepID=UPI0036A0B4F0
MHTQLRKPAPAPAVAQPVTLTRRQAITAAVVLVAYIATIPVANWLVSTFGPVRVGFGYQAPAGVYMVGLTLVLRDAVQQLLGRRAALYAVATGVVVSWVLATPALALASVVGFAVSELADAGVYTWLRDRYRQHPTRGLIAAVLAANVTGLALDSLLFLGIAFHSETFLPGQILAKTYMTLAAVVVIAAYRGTLRRPSGRHTA